MSDAHRVTREFESALCEYTGAPYAVTTTSCTQALLMALAYCFRAYPTWERKEVMIPKRTYVGVAASIRNAGGTVLFQDLQWHGGYQLVPYPVWDYARRFTSGMWNGGMQCVSFHWSKILGLSQGGAILTDNEHAAAWLRRARFDGRSERIHVGDDQIQYPSWHAYLSPEVAAHGLMKLSLLPEHNEDLPNSDYPDLSLQECFK